MTTGYCDPNRDYDVNWGTPASGDHYICIDEGIRQSTSGTCGTGETVIAGPDDDGDTEEFNMETITETDINVSQIVVWTYGMVMSTSSGNRPTVDLYNGSGYEGAQTVTMEESNSWQSNTFSSIDMDQTDLNNFRVKYVAGTINKLQGCIICEMYAVVTYTTPTGWGHKFLGVAGANIGKISGLPIANVGKVKGVAI